MSGKKKRKLRVALRKNRQKRTRDRDVVRKALEDELGEDRLSSREAVGKSALSRYRTVIGEEAEQGTPLLEVDQRACLRGRVLRAVGPHCTVQTEQGERVECTVRRLVRTLARDERTAVVAGDVVLFRPTGPGEGVVERVEPRHGVLTRAAQHREHVLVANVDQVLVVASAAEPELKPHLIDRFLVSAGKGGVNAVVCINKVDLVEPAELQPIAGGYARLGYDVVLTSVVSGFGLPRLRRLLKDRQTVLAGQSGVGKSSLLNAIDPQLGRKVGTVSRVSGKGTHTTRYAELLELSGGGWVVDTPGIRQMSLWGVEAGEIEAYFVEFRPLVPQCRFPDCTHRQEHGCAVRRAVDLRLIDLDRYLSYLRLFEEAAA